MLLFLFPFICHQIFFLELFFTKLSLLFILVFLSFGFFSSSILFLLFLSFSALLSFPFLSFSLSCSGLVLISQCFGRYRMAKWKKYLLPFLFLGIKNLLFSFAVVVYCFFWFLFLFFVCWEGGILTSIIIIITVISFLSFLFCSFTFPISLHNRHLFHEIYSSVRHVSIEPYVCVSAVSAGAYICSLHFPCIR